MISDNSQCINLSDVNQHSSRMGCCFYNQCDHLVDYFNDSVPNGAVVYADDFPFQYDKQEGVYTKFLDNPMGCVCLTANKTMRFYSAIKVQHHMFHIYLLSPESPIMTT